MPHRASQNNTEQSNSPMINGELTPDSFRAPSPIVSPLSSPRSESVSSSARSQLGHHLLSREHTPPPHAPSTELSHSPEPRRPISRFVRGRQQRRGLTLVGLLSLYQGIGISSSHQQPSVDEAAAPSVAVPEADDLNGVVDAQDTTMSVASNAPSGIPSPVRNWK